MLNLISRDLSDEGMLIQEHLPGHRGPCVLKYKAVQKCKTNVL